MRDSIQLGVCLDDLGAAPKASMDLARRLGFRAIDVLATAGPISADALSRTGRRHLLHHLDDLGLRLASLRGPAGGGGYADSATGERRLETMRKVIDLAASMGVPVVSTTVGRVPAPDAARASDRLKEAMGVLADVADRAGVVIAVETVGIGSESLSHLLRTIGCPLLASCCDTGAMLMQGEDPHDVGKVLAGRVRLARARDAVAGDAGESGYEVAMGQGELDPRRLLAGLTEAGFDGDIILSRTTGDHRAGDLERAKAIFDEAGRGGILPG